MKIVQKIVKSKLSFVVALLLFNGLEIGAAPVKFAIIGDYGEMGEDGAMQVEATDKELSLRFITISGEIADEITMTK